MQMLGEMTPSDMNQWDAYSQVEPFGDVFLLRGLALIWAYLVSRDSSDEVEPQSFMDCLADGDLWQDVPTQSPDESEDAASYEVQARNEQLIVQRLVAAQRANSGDRK